ncbi:hypothetical protein SAMN05444166_4227 [Singulisphaera sp. GP187]|uniref:hypothetical protein n=1 Tax=Singulisphaera sp. GP187 TaxID=1882752 RepID=UPI000929D79D|nr:hypothetical protein [Singulisphaera sp. GP187]SIO37916.1 hypothetical protein SAMN05444166_4227 [Singulisphaera sp. GP187]
MTPQIAVILPDGRLDRDGARFVNDDVPLELIEFPVITENARGQSHYAGARLAGKTHDEAFSHAAYKVASFPIKPFQDWERIVFVSLDSHRNKISDNFDQQVAYWRMRKAGESHNMAEMLALRSFPGIKTDAIFNEGKFSGQSTGECDPRGAWLRQQAEAAGVSTSGKWYCSGLASFPGDPTAWVGDRGDVLRIAREKNLTVDGYVTHKAHEVDPGSDMPIADDIIADEVNDILESNPFADAEAVRDEVYKLRTGAVDDHPLLVQD